MLFRYLFQSILCYYNLQFYTSQFPYILRNHSFLVGFHVFVISFLFINFSSKDFANPVNVVGKLNSVPLV